MGLKPRPKNTITRKSAAANIVARRPPCISVLLRDSARVLLSNALIAARKSHAAIVQGHCSHCGGSKERHYDTSCVLCALLQYRGLPTNGDLEPRAAELLGVPERWVLDMVSGFDQDGDTVVYRDAKNLGGRLWRKYGGPRAR